MLIKGKLLEIATGDILTWYGGDYYNWQIAGHRLINIPAHWRGIDQEYRERLCDGKHKNLLSIREYTNL